MTRRQTLLVVVVVFGRLLLRTRRQTLLVTVVV